MLKDQRILITGSTDGIGYRAALELAKSGYRIIIHGRNREKAEFTLNKIKNETNSDQLSYVYADLASLKEIKEMASQIHEKFDRLDVLINNAGIIRSNHSLTQDGIETTFAVNYVSPFLLTNLLMDLLKNAESSRIVNVVSQVHSNHFDFEDLHFERGYTAVKAYARSKTALILFTYSLAEKLKGNNITVNCLHPGVINTKLLEAGFGSYGAPPIEGAKALIYAATSPDLENISGKYFVENRSKDSKEITYNKTIQKKLWQKTEEMVGKEFSY